MHVTKSELTFDVLANHFHEPISTAAPKLGVCPTVLKNLCRELGLSRWPFRQIQSLTNMINKLEKLSANVDATSRQVKINPLIEELKKKKELVLKDPRIHNEPLMQQRKHFRTLYKKYAKKSKAPQFIVDKNAAPRDQKKQKTVVSPVYNEYPKNVSYFKDAFSSSRNSECIPLSFMNTTNLPMYQLPKLSVLEPQITLSHSLPPTLFPIHL